jgi:hypothetical protein
MQGRRTGVALYIRGSITRFGMAAKHQPSDLHCVDCTDPGRGAWRVLARPKRRCYLVEHRRTLSRLTVYYGTRTERTVEDAEQHATAVCAVLNALKAKRV